MKTVIPLLIFILLAACSDSARDTEQQVELNAQTTEHSSNGVLDEKPLVSSNQGEPANDATINPSLEQTDESFDESSQSELEMTDLDALILKNTRAFAERQKDQSELANIAELENLSEATREAIKQQSAKETADAAQKKAEEQAVSEVLKRIPD